MWCLWGGDCSSGLGGEGGGCGANRGGGSIYGVVGSRGGCGNID